MDFLRRVRRMSIEAWLLRLAICVALMEFLFIVHLELKVDERAVLTAESLRAHPHFPYGADIPNPYPVDTSKFTKRQWAVVRAIRHAWQGYKQCALGHDMLITEGNRTALVDGFLRLESNCTFEDWGRPRPSSGQSKRQAELSSQFNRVFGHEHDREHEDGADGTTSQPKMIVPSKSGIALTLVESLDTLWLAGEHSEFFFAVEWIKRHLTFDVSVDVSLFETTIRVLGGLISAYELSGEPILLEKAYDLGDRLMHSWVQEEIIPLATVNLKYHNASQPTWLGQTQSLSEVTTIQIEFKKLSYWTGDDRFDQATARIMPFVFNGIADTPLGLPTAYIHRFTGAFDGRRSLITLGARGDSFYEYVVKLWWLTNRTDRLFEVAYSNLRDAIGNHLIIQVDDGRYFIAEADYYTGHRFPKMDHLACFAPGMFLLGRDSKEKKFFRRDSEIAEAVGQLCHEMYNMTNTGLGPEITKFGPPPQYKMFPGAWHYILRPEALEAMFYLKRYTRDPKWGEYAWAMFQAIETNLKMENGYSGVHNVSRGEGNATLRFTYKMESFFLAETLKYALLSQEDDRLPLKERLLPLDEWVFNTEAHPVRIYTPDGVGLRTAAHDVRQSHSPDPNLPEDGSPHE